ncbi:hypothetical protein JCM12141A_27070 [Mycolicibacterium hodleri]
MSDLPGSARLVLAADVTPLDGAFTGPDRNGSPPSTPSENTNVWVTAPEVSLVGGAMVNLAAGRSIGRQRPVCGHG